MSITGPGGGGRGAAGTAGSAAENGVTDDGERSRHGGGVRVGPRARPGGVHQSVARLRWVWRSWLVMLAVSPPITSAISGVARPTT